MTLSKAQRAAIEAERDEARESLREELPPGATVYTVLSHLSRSGMMRSIKAVIAAEVSDRHGTRPGISDLSWRVARLGEFKFDRDNGGVKVGGAGMDMGYHLVYSLSRVLYRDGFDCIGDGCPANDHVNARNGEPVPGHHRDGGYALRHQWL